MSARRSIGLRPNKLIAATRYSVTSIRNVSGVIACVLVVVSLGLFVERYGINTVRYGTPTPECNQVLSIEACRAYDPFNRNQNYKDLDLKSDLSHEDLATFPTTWFHSLLRSMYFSVGPRMGGYQTGSPLQLAYAAGYIGSIAGLIAIAWRAKKLWRSSHAFQLFLIVIVVYVVTLFLQNLSDYLQLGIPVAIQGRYMMPVLPLGLALGIVALRDMLQRFDARVSATLFMLMFLLMVEGGGFLPFIIRSNDTWIWNNPVSQHMNREARAILWREIVH